ncbi:hypothetical protein niasHT_017706 [Heterodera trifolii]|uniref:Uncharacterized protein n=1 Tax=Heterodera trifolii TaxID=157864 RepID=A0ABD2L8H2_9BILA
MTVQSDKILSSVPLELLLRINSKFSILFCLLTYALFIYKIFSLPYPLHVLLSEAFIVLLFGPIEAFRISSARTGNLTETSSDLFFSLLLGIAVAAICAYLALLQTYVAFVEQIGASIEFVLVTLEALLQLFTMITFSTNRSTASSAVQAHNS